MTLEEAREFLSANGNNEIIINDDFSFDVNGGISLIGMGLKKIPFKFNKVSGFFDCSDNELTSLENCPIEVGGDFYCRQNKLKDLIGSPKKVGGNFHCENTGLTSLEGSPERVYSFYCDDNKLTSLEGCPIIIDDEFDCSNNKLTSLKNGPKKIGYTFICRNNDIYDLEGLDTEFRTISLFKCPIQKVVINRNYEFINWLKTFKVIKGKEVNLKRLKYVYGEFNTIVNQEVIDRISEKYIIV